MEDLKRLVKVITRLKLRQSPLLDFKGVDRNSSKENIFYRYIGKGIVQTDDEASRLLYGTKSDDDRFRMLKSRLKHKLLNHLYFLDFSGVIPEYNAEEEECIKYLHQAKVLMMVGQWKMARSLISKALSLAEKNEFTAHSISALEDLILIFSEASHPHLFEETVEKLREARILYAKESSAREQFYFMKMMILKSVNSRKKNLGNAQNYLRTLEKLWDETGSYNVFEFLFELSLIIRGLTGSFSEIITMLEEVERKRQYRNHRLNQNRFNRVYVVKHLAFAYLRQWELEKGLSYAASCKGLFKPATPEWFDFHESYFLLALRNKAYQLANDIIRDVTINKSFADIPDRIKNRWDIYYIYLRLAESAGIPRDIKGFYIPMEIPENKEDEGYNVALLIWQLVYFLSEGNFDKVRKRRDAIKGYMANHFKETFSYRTRTFYKLLNILVEQNFQQDKIQQKSRYLLSKLSENRIISTAHRELEAIPYEQIWEIINRLLRDSTTSKVLEESHQF